MTDTEKCIVEKFNELSELLKLADRRLCELRAKRQDTARVENFIYIAHSLRARIHRAYLNGSDMTDAELKAAEETMVSLRLTAKSL